MTSAPFTVACVQLCPGDDLQQNLHAIAQGVSEAVSQGAVLVALPEFATFLHASGKAMRAQAEPEQGNGALEAIRAIARNKRVWILIGSIALRGEGDRLINRSYLVSGTGSIEASYDKIHMFDATLPNGREIRESTAYEAGSQAVAIDTPWARLGLSVCYDVRFPMLFRTLAHAGAQVLAIPSAFTRPTGELHWHALMQARAIENAAYVIAPATCGTHPGGHQTYGHAMIVDPNGRILAEAATEPAVIVATLDPSLVTAARARIPSLTHDRDFVLRLVETGETHESI